MNDLADYYYILLKIFLVGVIAALLLIGADRFSENEDAAGNQRQ